METETKNDVANKVEQELSKDPMGILLGAMIEQALETSSKLTQLLTVYRDKGETSIPISELDECITAGMNKAFSKNSLTYKLLNRQNEEEKCTNSNQD